MRQISLGTGNPTPMIKSLYKSLSIDVKVLKDQLTYSMEGIHK